MPEVKEGCKVVILGAGASRGAIVPSAPPTVREFFSSGMRIARTDYTQLWNALAGLGYTFESLRSGRFSLEEVFSELSGWERWIEGKSLRQIHQELGAELYGCTPASMLEFFIADVLYPASMGALRNPCINHVRFLERLEPGDVVISFNYDLICEAALSAARGWSSMRGYGFEGGPDSIVMDEADQWVEAVKATDVLLLKAHGSLNWLPDNDNIKIVAPSTLEDPSAEFKKSTDYWKSDIASWKRHLPDDDSWLDYRKLGRSRPALIVPPTFDKFTGTMPANFRKVWSMIESALQKASGIVSVGFSFAPADVHFSALLKAQIRCNSRERIRLDIIDLDPKVANRMSHFSPKLEVHHAARTLKEFLKLP